MSNNVIFEDATKSMRITEVSAETIHVGLKPSINDNFSPYFTQSGATIIGSSPEYVTWEMSKTPTSSTRLTHIIGADITSLYRISPKVQGISAGGMTFSSPISAVSSSTLPQSAGSQQLPDTSSKHISSSGSMPNPQMSSNLSFVAGQPLPMPEVRTSSPSEAAAYQPPGLPSSLPSASGFTLGKPLPPGMRGVGSSTGSAHTERQPTKLVIGGEDYGFWVHDYSAASIAVFLGNSLVEGYGDFLTSSGGKGCYLYPDGGTSGKRGWIFAKSNDDAMTAISNLFQTDIKTVVDFSNVRKRGGSAKSSNFRPPAAEAQVTTGPFAQGIAATLPARAFEAAPPPSFSIPGLPDVKLTLSTIDLVAKNIEEMIITSQIVDKISSKSSTDALGVTTWTFIGPIDEVTKAVSNLESSTSNVEITFTSQVGLNATTQAKVKSY
jgi:hypothetical protein